MDNKNRLQYVSVMIMQGLLASSDYDWAVDDELVDEDEMEDATFADKVSETSVQMAKALIKRLDEEDK